MLRYFFVFALLAAGGTAFAQQEEKNDPRLEEAWDLDSLGKHERALKMFLELAEEPALRAKALRSAAACEFDHLHQLEEAFGHINQAIAADPTYAWGYMNRATMYTEVGMPDRALEDMNVALPLAKDTATLISVYVNRGVVYQTSRQFEKALKDFETVLAMDSVNEGAMLNRAATLDDLGRPEEALAIVMRMSAKDPENIVYINNAGFLLLGMERYAEAAELFSRGLEKQPDDAYMLNNRGYAKLKAGDNKGALKDVERSIKIHAANSYAYRNLGLIHQAMGEKDKACDAFEQALGRGYTQMYGDDVKNIHATYCR
jgi:tetratricopeptide (TPR) repeat protein